MANDLAAQEVAAAIIESIGVFSRQLRQAPVNGELTFSELFVLGRLERVGTATMSDLARASQVTPQAIRLTIGALESRGLLKRATDSSDGRQILVSMTKSGTRQLRQRREALSEQMANILSERFTRSELETLLVAAPLIERLGDGL